MRPKSSARSDLGLYLALLVGFFFLIEVSFFIQCNQVYFGDFTFISKRLSIPAGILPAIVFFGLVQVGLHVLYFLGLLGLSLWVSRSFKLSVQVTEKLGVGLWLGSVVLILSANEFYFPNSIFAELTRTVVPDAVNVGLLAGGLVGVVGAGAWLCFKNFKLPALVFLTASLLMAVAWMERSDIRVISLAKNSPTFSAGVKTRMALRFIQATPTKQPNIIIIGMDSVRPDALSFFGSDLKTPFITSFLKDATVFNEAYTPLARTFPSWIGILSGLYPNQTGVRFNLPRQETINPQVMLSTLLKQNGYRTVYATDETRFSNINQDLGFDQMITPPVGLNDFLLGTFNDFPLSNFVVNTFLGPYLFPYSYANRPAFVTYRPQTFVTLLKSKLNFSSQQPIFLAIHLCLPHYPYVFNQASGHALTSSVSRYRASIEGVDGQVKAILSSLKAKGLLEHAVVVLLSDHGEALELPGDRITAEGAYVGASKPPRFYPASTDDEAFNQSAGHGTDVLGLSQYQTLLAFKLYGMGSQVKAIDSTPVLLLNIKATLLDFLNLKHEANLSLKPTILGQTKSSTLKNQFYFESDYSPQAIRSAHPEMRDVVLEGVELFAIDPKTLHVYVKETMAELILSSKQYAAVRSDWILALYPQAHQHSLPVLVQRHTGRWTTDLNSAFAQRSPAKQMLKDLRNFYGSEIHF